MKLILSLILTIVSIAGCVNAQQRSTERHDSLPNGVYAVLREAPTAKEAQPEKEPFKVLIYDQKHSPSDQDAPPKYLALDTSDFVPLILAEPPQARKDDRGWTLLNVRLAPAQEKALEKFTRDHLNGHVAIVIDGEVITTHKVRSVITDGHAMISRCQDNACETLRLKLTK